MMLMRTLHKFVVVHVVVLSSVLLAVLCSALFVLLVVLCSALSVLLVVLCSALSVLL